MLGGSAGNDSSGNGGLYQQRLKEKEDEVALLQERVNSLSAQLQTALTNNASSPTSNNGISMSSSSSSSKKRRHIPLSPHAMNVREVMNEQSSGNLGGYSHNSAGMPKTSHISAQRERLGRNASIATRRVLDRLEEQRSHSAMHPSTGLPAPIQRIVDMFQRPAQHMEYLNSETFAKDLYKVTVRVTRQYLEREPRVVFLQSPAYVFGDIHGNLEDLHFFSDNLWRLGMSLTAGNFLFLGDYVDRGLQCLECVAYLFAMKLQNPTKVFLLRGNHETRDVNGWEEHYGERSFIFQCRSRFGDDIGYRLWEVCNQAFDRMPLAAVIDQDIFCVHGGIPRPISNATTRIQDILTVPKVAGINPPYEHEDEKYQQVASDCIWSDPASEEQELSTVDPMTGYGESLRGGGAICFGNKAVTQFLQQQDYSYIMRAHEAHAEGVAVSKEARVFTVFSTSKDHNQGALAMAGCILVDNDKLQVINRSPAYKNQYVHRRDSVSLANVSEHEIQKRIQLGLVTGDNEDDGNDDDDEQGQGDEVLVDETWQDFESSSDEERQNEAGNAETAVARKDSTSAGGSASLRHSSSLADVRGSGEYVFDKTRRSSVDLATMNTHQAMHAAAEWDQQQQQQPPPLPPQQTFAGASSNHLFEQAPHHQIKRVKQGSIGSLGGSAAQFAPIDENNAVEDAEIETVDGDTDGGAESDDVMEPEI